MTRGRADTEDGRADTEDGRARVFLSWSGEPSRLVARALRDCISALSDRLEPWLSEGLEPGTEWANALVPQIRKSKLAILCLTHRNVNAPWIAFETGAYYSSRLKKAVIPFLLDFPADDQPAFPLGLFQSLRADWTGTKALFVRVGELAELDAKTVEEKLAREIWPQLSDQLATIRGLKPDDARTDEPGNWMNIANAFFLGHDLRWTIDVLAAGAPADDVKHGLQQTLHQADELGLSKHDLYLVLAKQAGNVLPLEPDEWTPEVRTRLGAALNLAFERFGNFVISSQPGYHPYDPANQESWLRYQAEGRA